MTLKLLADENIPAVEHYVGELGEVRRFAGRELRARDLAGADVLLVRSVTAVNEQLLAGSAVRFVGTATSGIDHVDREYLAGQGIGFRHAPGSNANSVVEYVLAAIAAVDDHLERLLAGGTVGVVGYGVIGKAVTGRLQAMGIRFKVYDPWLDQAAVRHAATLQEILACEVITLHPELTREQPWPSYHLFDGAALDQLQVGCLLINASRGAVVDNSALEALLTKGRGPALVLDVWEGEPGINPNLLQQVRQGTPHIAGYSLDGKLLATRMLVEAMAAQLELPWRDPGSAAGPAPAITLPAGLDGAALLRHLLACRYDIRRDDAALRQATLAVDEVDAANGFDRLRREYPQRRELAGSLVRVQGIPHELLRGLGCVTGEGST